MIERSNIYIYTSLRNTTSFMVSLAVQIEIELRSEGEKEESEQRTQMGWREEEARESWGGERSADV